MQDTDRQEPTEVQQTIAWCDEKNREAGKKLMKWLQIQPEDDPDSYIGIHPDTSALIGPGIHVGRRYRIVYASPVRLPFQEPEEGSVAIHVAEITGTLTSPFAMKDVECVICAPEDYSVTETMRADKSEFRFFVGDKLEQL